jgi:hypothetical protein
MLGVFLGFVRDMLLTDEEIKNWWLAGVDYVAPGESRPAEERKSWGLVEQPTGLFKVALRPPATLPGLAMVFIFERNK